MTGSFRTLTLTLVLLAGALGSARAQTASPAAAGHPKSLAPATLQVDPAVRAAWELQRKSRLMLTIGAASALSSAIFFGWASQTAPCSGDDPGLRTGDIVAGSVVGGLGAGLSIGGAIGIERGARRAKRRASGVEQAWLMLLGLGVLATTQTLLYFVRPRHGWCPS